tara:strand:- start:44 stop:1000 length:957 start_codon:yes stop_codon:yes gene_type:complete
MLRLRKKIYEDETAGYDDFKYCRIHKHEYWVIDAAYAFNRCSHAVYYKNLQITAFKIKHINPEASIIEVTEAVKQVMSTMAKSVKYPSVKESEVKGIVKSIWKQDINSITDFIHGGHRNTATYKNSNSTTKVFNLRTTEWKYPEVNELIEMTEDELKEYEGIEDQVEAYIFKTKLSSSKKLSYANTCRAKSRADETDSIIKNTILELKQDLNINVITESKLYSVLCDEMTRKTLSDGLCRLQASNCVVSSTVKQNNNALAEESIVKIRNAGYELNNKGLKINKNKIHKETGVSLTTIRKRWGAVEEEFNELNNRLNNN